MGTAMMFGTTVTILYKSGQKVHLRVKDFKVEHTATGKLTLTWDTGNLPKRPLWIGVEDVVAVYKGKM